VREDYFGQGANNAAFFSIPINLPGGTGPNQGFFGSLGRNTFRGPAYYDFDFSLIKDTPVGSVPQAANFSMCSSAPSFSTSSTSSIWACPPIPSRDRSLAKLANRRNLTPDSIFCEDTLLSHTYAGLVEWDERYIHTMTSGFTRIAKLTCWRRCSSWRGLGWNRISRDSGPTRHHRLCLQRRPRSPPVERPDQYGCPRSLQSEPRSTPQRWMDCPPPSLAERSWCDSAHW
jgi:hypothetical protein